MTKRFLFVAALTPSRLLTPLRKLLFEEFLKGLEAQEYPHWEAILIGEQSQTQGKIKYLSIGAESKEIKLIYAKEYINSMAVKPDFVIRIDDDDIISPLVLKHAAGIEFDCYADRYHAFYDVVSGKISLQERSFLANTVIHKFEHAMAETGPDNIPLLQCDHSTWIDYYENKNLVYTPKANPVYLRVLSPTTVTNGVFEKKGNVPEQYDLFKSEVVKMKKSGDINFEHYRRYLKTHGSFHARILPAYAAAQQKLAAVWKSFSGELRTETLYDRLEKKWFSLVNGK